MLILLPVILMFLTALALVAQVLVRPKFKYPWILAAGGALFALASVFLWQLQFPGIFTLPSWQLVNSLLYTPAWLADVISWPYALALAALATAVIWTSVVRGENNPMPWVGTLVLVAFGILAVAAKNPVTLLLAWSAIDLFELITLLRSTDGKSQIDSVIITFATHLVGTGLLLWANLMSAVAGIPLDFHSIPHSTGIYLLIAVGLRVGVLPLRLPYQKENILQRGFGTVLRLVTAATSLALLARIPVASVDPTLTPYLLTMAAIAALYAGWMWLRSPDEILGRPFWIMGMASLAIGESLRGNPTGSTSWGVSMILCGGFLFLFSARRKSTLWMPFVALWALSALPFSLTASSWQTDNIISKLFVIPFLPAQAFMLAGFLRHAIQHPGGASLESQEKWVRAIYPIGLLILIATALLLGFWGWDGAWMIGLWWLAILVILLAAGFAFLVMRVLIHLRPANTFTQWARIFRINWLHSLMATLYTYLSWIAGVITAALEGEGGLLWSFLLLVLILSIISTNSR